MALEIERKFLLKDDRILEGRQGLPYRQGYIPAADATVRVRIAGEQGYLTLKKPGPGSARHEFEYEIPLTDALQLLGEFCAPKQIDKTRYLIEHQGMTWEVDRFHGENHGLLLAEIELDYEGQPIVLPDWVGVEVSDDPRYHNAYLAVHPYSSWNNLSLK